MKLILDEAARKFLKNKSSVKHVTISIFEACNS